MIGTLGPTVHVRFFLRLGSALAQGHGGMIITHPTMVDQYAQQNRLRFGSQDNVFHWNTDSDSANIPDVSPNGDALSIKARSRHLVLRPTRSTPMVTSPREIDGTDVPGLAEDWRRTPNIDQAWVGAPHHSPMPDRCWGGNARSDHWC